MCLLVHTHALLWLITGYDRLSPAARAIFLDPVNDPLLREYDAPVVW